MSAERLAMEQRMREMEESGRDIEAVPLLRKAAEKFASVFRKRDAQGQTLPPCKSTVNRWAREGQKTASGTNPGTKTRHNAPAALGQASEEA